MIKLLENFYDKVPYELHRLNENLEELINLLILKEDGTET